MQRLVALATGNSSSNRDGNGVGNRSRVISHVMAVWQSRILLHPSISLSPSSICRGSVQRLRLRLRLRQMATATGITALRCTWNSCRCCCCCCCCCHPFVLLLSLFDSNRIICSVCIRSLISHISQMCVYSPLSLPISFSFLLSLFLSLSIYISLYDLTSFCLYWFRCLRCICAFIFISPFWVFRHASLPLSHPSSPLYFQAIRKKSKLCARFFFGCIFLVFFFLLCVCVCVFCRLFRVVADR